MVYYVFSPERYIFCSKTLNLKLTIKEAGILDNSEIYVIEHTLI